MDCLVGRYAPTPSGAFHPGNLRTAVAAYCSARHRGGRFLLRIEDLDRARCRSEFQASQLDDLKRLGIDWDEEPIRQSTRDDVYQQWFDRLIQARLVYPCFCSRREIREALSAPHGPSTNIYPGTCSHLSHAESLERLAAGEQHCWRLRVAQAPTTFFDGFLGEVAMNLVVEGGDFVVRRADGYFGYQFACALDDALSGVTEVLRGADLLDSGARQAYIIACLRLSIPRYLHIPLVVSGDGERLAKRLGSQDLRGLAQRGHDTSSVLSWIGWSLGLLARGERVTSAAELVTRWNLNRIPRESFVFLESDLEAFH